MQEITYNEWVKQAEIYFATYVNGHGPFLNFNNVKFKCVQCGHIQSVNSVIRHNPFLNTKDVEKWIHCNCEGRVNKDYGCDWTLYGLFQHQNTIIVKRNGKEVKAFPFAKEKRKRNRSDCEYFYFHEDQTGDCSRKANEHRDCDEYYCPLPEEEKQKLFKIK
jgi:hypothetical protein